MSINCFGLWHLVIASISTVGQDSASFSVNFACFVGSWDLTYFAIQASSKFGLEVKCSFGPSQKLN